MSTHRGKADLQLCAPKSEIELPRRSVGQLTQGAKSSVVVLYHMWATIPLQPRHPLQLSRRSCERHSSSIDRKVRIAGDYGDSRIANVNLWMAVPISDIDAN
jgi:hypothetical protein